MIIEAELLRDHVDKQCFFTGRELIHTFRPKWNRKTQQEYCLNQDNRKFKMRRDTAGHSLMICRWLSPFSETNYYVNKKCRPPNKKCRHEPMTELEDMIDLISVRRGV